MLASVFFVLAALLLCAPAADAGDGDGKGARPGHAVKPIPGRYIVTVDKSTDPKGLADKHGAKTKFVYRHAINGFAAELTDRQVEALRRHPNVRSLEQDQLGGVEATQFTNANGEPYGLDRIDQRFLPLSRSFTYNVSGSGVRGYILDTGVQTGHSQFGGRASAVWDAFGGNGQDCHGHGTHVAGTVAGATWGVAKSALIRSVRILDCSGSGSTSQAIAGVDWVRQNAVRPAVANMSVGYPYSAAFNQAVTNLVNSGVFVAVAAGNESNLACSRSPASAPGTFTVAASDSSDSRASFSNYGSCVDGYAPGVNTLSAALGGGAKYLSGTSMATPHVAGAVALAKSRYGDSYTSAAWVNWVISSSTTNVIRGNPTGTPNRLLFKGSL